MGVLVVPDQRLGNNNIGQAFTSDNEIFLQSQSSDGFFSDCWTMYIQQVPVYWEAIHRVHIAIGQGKYTLY